VSVPASASAWKIGRRAPGCSACGSPFEDGAAVFSALVLEPAIARVDRCGGCHRGRERSDAEILWRTRHRASPRRARVDLAALVEIFRGLLGREDEKAGDLRYLVALLLLRHRKLRLVATRSRGGRDVLVVAFARQRAEHAVHVSELPAEALDRLRGELLALLEGSSEGRTEGRSEGEAAGADR
jgi:hypothetical protein